MSEAPGTGTPVVVSVRPHPEPAVLAALVAAVQEAWPRPRPVEDAAVTRPVWRFSGRWWNQPAALRRARPRPGH